MCADFITVEPLSPVLKKHIPYIYIEHYSDPSFSRRYTFYPHIYTCLSFYKEISYIEKGSSLYVNYAPDESLKIILTRQRSPHTVTQRGRIRKIGLVFNPLGLNHFIRDSYKTIASKERQPFTLEAWIKEGEKCFDLQSIEAIQVHLEDFLLSVYQPKEFIVLEKVVSALMDIENTDTIEEIAVKNKLSRRSLHRQFLEHIQISPELFRMIARFRYVVNKKIVHNSLETFTRLCYDAGYQDQSYMIRSFKKLTGLTPKEFFQTGSVLGSKDTFWKIHSPVS